MTVPEDKLKEIECVYLVAGGQGKAAAVYQLLKRKPERVNIRVLVTDSDTSELLIRWAPPR